MEQSLPLKNLHKQDRPCCPGVSGNGRSIAGSGCWSKNTPWSLGPTLKGGALQLRHFPADVLSLLQAVTFSSHALRDNILPAASSKPDATGARICHNPAFRRRAERRDSRGLESFSTRCSQSCFFGKSLRRTSLVLHSLQSPKQDFWGSFINRPEKCEARGKGKEKKSRSTVTTFPGFQI